MFLLVDNPNTLLNINMKKSLSWLLVSRSRVVFVAIGILLILDAGRSLYARFGYASPAEHWQEAPYEAMAWPPGADLPSGSPLGERVYIERCAICHGPKGRGDGPAAPSMIPRPRDFTQGAYKYTSTADGEIPTDADLIRVVKNGLQASGMPYWGDILGDEEIVAVVHYIKGFSTRFDRPDPRPITVPPRVAPSEASIARGKALYLESGCDLCHGEDGRADKTLEDNKGYPVRSRDLTAPWTFRGGSRPEDIWLRLTTGMAPGPMPSYELAMTAGQRWDVVNYVLSLARTPPWEAGGVLDGPGGRADLKKRGEYLVHAEMCGLCHTQVNAAMIYSGDGYYLAGGMGIPAYPQGTLVSRNLTPDPETGLGDWTEDEIANAIRNGRGRGRLLNLWGMPWMFLHSFEREDALSIATYLKSLPPVTNKIPLPLRYGFIETAIAKAVYSSGLPPIGNPKALTYKAGNYGQTQPGLLPRDWPQSLLIIGQWLILAGGVISFVIAGPRERRFPRGYGGWIRFGLIFFGLILVVFLLWVIYSTPMLAFIPPEQVNLAVASTIHTPDPASFRSTEEAALAKRGQYLFKVTSCAFCHGNDGSGGSKISMKSFGTLWVRNITPDTKTGIGSWSDAQIARAIRSGVSKDGGVLHWQGMIWDHLSNLDEEDVRALILYLRALPPVAKKIPSPSPPSPEDCEEYTFFLIDSKSPGCEDGGK
jgi:mono/diheme cytochrome c family protein